MKSRTLTSFGHMLPATLLAGLMVCASEAMAQPVITNAADGSGSAAFWYLNGLPSCCADSPGGAIYYTQWQLNVSGASGTTVWSTDSPTLVSIAPAPNGLSAILTALGSSDTTAQHQATYNVHIYVTAGGVRSAPFPVYINTPFSFSATAEGQLCTALGCGCNYNPLWQGWMGYAGWYADSGYDILGYTLVQIDLHETLENFKWTPNSNWSQYVPPAAPTSFPANVWLSNTVWADGYAICSPQASRGFINPTPLPWGNGNTAVVSDTQKFWIGTTNLGFTGSCIDRSIVTYYTDHAANSGQQTPGIPAAICSAGQFAN